MSALRTAFIIDTNIWLKHKHIISGLFDAAPQYGYLIILPNAVPCELDGLKNRRGDVGFQARAAHRPIFNLFSVRDPNLVAQRHCDVQTSGLGGDDAILDCALFFLSKYKLIFMSKDHCLCSRALMEGITVISSCEHRTVISIIQTFVQCPNLEQQLGLVGSSGPRDVIDISPEPSTPSPVSIVELSPEPRAEAPPQSQPQPQPQRLQDLAYFAAQFPAVFMRSAGMVTPPAPTKPQQPEPPLRAIPLPVSSEHRMVLTEAQPTTTVRSTLAPKPMEANDEHRNLLSKYRAQQVALLSKVVQKHPNLPPHMRAILKGRESSVKALAQISKAKPETQLVAATEAAAEANAGAASTVAIKPKPAAQPPAAQIFVDLTGGESDDGLDVPSQGSPAPDPAPSQALAVWPAAADFDGPTRGNVLPPPNPPKTVSQKVTKYPQRDSKRRRTNRDQENSFAR